MCKSRVSRSSSWDKGTLSSALKLSGASLSLRPCLGFLLRPPCAQQNSWQGFLGFLSCFCSERFMGLRGSHSMRTPKVAEVGKTCVEGRLRRPVPTTVVPQSPFPTSFPLRHIQRRFRGLPWSQ